MEDPDISKRHSPDLQLKEWEECMIGLNPLSQHTHLNIHMHRTCTHKHTHTAITLAGDGVGGMMLRKSE